MVRLPERQSVRLDPREELKQKCSNHIGPGTTVEVNAGNEGAKLALLAWFNRPEDEDARVKSMVQRMKTDEGLSLSDLGLSQSNEQFSSRYQRFETCDALSACVAAAWVECNPGNRGHIWTRAYGAPAHRWVPKTDRVRVMTWDLKDWLHGDSVDRVQAVFVQYRKGGEWRLRGGYNAAGEPLNVEEVRQILSDPTPTSGTKVSRKEGTR